MSFQYLSEEQRARYRRFLTDPSSEDLERFFYLDADALAELAKKRGPHNRLGWGLQWGTARMLGTFLADPGALFILDALHRLDAKEQSEVLTTDTASYSDIVFGLFAICGYQFAPRIADISDAQQWWIDPADVGAADKRTTPAAAGYGRLTELNLRRVNIALIKQHWPQMLQVAGSLVTNKVRAYDLIKMMTADGRTTGLGHAFAHYGRIFKSMHLLHVAHLEDYRRMMGAQLNVGEGRNGLARAVFFAHHGQLRRGYERGMEDQLGALGLGLNAIIFWNSLYIDAPVKRLAAGGMKIGPEIRAALSPLQWEHINFHGTYSFNRPELPGRLRDLRDPTAADDDPEL